MLCPQCQRENLPDAIFCEHCGARLETICSHCGEPNRRGATFCRICGQAINQTPTIAIAKVPGILSPDSYVPRHLAEKILASRPSLEGERKQVTVLFADIRDSMKLIENRDPEEAQKIIDPVLHLMMDAVHRYEGTVNQVLGDGIMALFGAPLAHEDHAVRACYAALAMQDEIRRHREKMGQSDELGLQIGIGLNSGEVVVRSIGNDLNIDYSALGHTTHLAARMEELASAGSILMAAATLREVEGFVEVKSLGAVQVKGVSRPIDAYELLGVTSARTRLHAALTRGLTPFVGRKTEIEAFQKLVEKSAAGRGQIFSMVGDPGMGKSRLVYEFIHFHVPPDWLVLEAPSVSYGKATPYFPVIEMLRRYCGISGGDAAESVQEKIVDHVLRLDEMLMDAIPPIFALLGVSPDGKGGSLASHESSGRRQNVIDATKKFTDMEPQQRRRHTFESLKRLMIRESQKQPLLLVFEDLHWIDSETQAFLDSLIESLPLTRVLVLVDYRPEYSHGWGDKTYYTQLRVDPLQPTSADELLQHLLGTNADLAPLKELLIRRTEGNPFFAEESVRSLVEAGVLVGEKAAYRPGLRIDEIRIPSTVQNVVADRIDRLPAEEKHLLQTAAVIGVIVPARLLQAVTELPKGDLQTYLAHLQAAEFLYESNLFPELEYTFKHALTNEVAYGALVHERKVFLHAKIVTALENVLGSNLQDHIETISQHAYRGELWEKAVAYSWQSGEKASQRSANQEARQFFQTGLRALEHLPQSRANLQQAVDLRLELRNALYFLSEFDELHRCLREAEAIAQRISDDRRLGRVINFLNSYYGIMGEHHRSIELGTRGLQINRDDVELNTVTHYYMGLAYHHVGQYDHSIDFLRRALTVTQEERFKYERFGTANILSVMCRIWLAQCSAQLGHFKDGKTLAEEAMTIAKEADHAPSLAWAHVALGFTHLVQGNVDSAIRTLETCQKICGANNIQVLMPHISSNLGYAYALAGRIDDAIPLMEKADAQSKLIGRKAAWALRLTWLGHASLLGQQHGAAREQAQRAVSLARDAGERGYEAWAHKLLGDVVLRNDSTELEQPEKYYNRALGLAKELGMRPLEAHCHVGLGESYVATGKRKRAHAEFSTARDLYNGMDMTFWLMRAEAALKTLAPGREASH